MTLMLHRGAEPIDYEGLCSVPVPAATSSHVPLPHHELVDMVKYGLGYYDHKVTNEQYGVTEDGMRFFGVLTLQSDYGSYTDVVGLRNSNDKTLPIGVSFGASCFVCDNLSFIGDHVIRKKHTPNALRLLPGLLAEIIAPLHEERHAQQETFERYRDTELSDQRADHAIMEMYRAGIVNVTRIPALLDQWNEPECDWGEKTAWRMFNAATFVLNGKVAEEPRITRDLHRVIDGVCEVIH